jgi:hypothetical protein
MNGPRADPAAPTGKPATPQAATSNAANRSDHPPKPRFALAIGIVGHRLKHWDDAKGTDGRSLRTEHLQKIAADVHLALKAIKAPPYRPITTTSHYSTTRPTPNSVLRS